MGGGAHLQRCGGPASGTQVRAIATLTSPPSPHPSMPATLNPWTHGKAPNNPYGVGVASLLAAKTTALPSSTLPRNLNCFPYLQKLTSRLALQLYITLETIQILRHDANQPLTAI